MVRVFREAAGIGVVLVHGDATWSVEQVESVVVPVLLHSVVTWTVDQVERVGTPSRHDAI